MRPRTLKRGAMAAMLLALAAGFVALGIWQVQRRVWKHALIAAVDARVAAPAVAAPGPAGWSALNADRDSYTHVAITGRYLRGRDTRVRAVSALGAGYWVMTPLDAGGFAVLVNRGFVPQGERWADSPPGAVTVTGLLRMSEPGGGFLRANDPAADRWYSRDVAAIARARGLRDAAPYFIDAAAGPGGGYPRGGLTVVRFADNHLAYALTWFAMAALSIAGLWMLLRQTARTAPE